MNVNISTANRFFWITLFLLLALLLSNSLQAEKKAPAGQNTPSYKSKAFIKNFKQNFLSCAIITSEHLTVLQLYQRGLAKKIALTSLPRITPDARKRVDYIYNLANDIGILNTYADINTNFARCATLVYEVKGKPAADQKEYGYYYCAGENKMRFELLLQFNQGSSLDEIYKSLPASHYHVAKNYHQLFLKKGLLAAFDYTANNLKACLKLIE